MRIYPGTRLENEAYQKRIYKKRIDWCKSVWSIKNAFILEPGDIPVMFQKQLGPFKLGAILVALLCKKLVCTEKFLLRMIAENSSGIVRIDSVTADICTPSTSQVFRKNQTADISLIAALAAPYSEIE